MTFGQMLYGWAVVSSGIVALFFGALILVGIYREQCDRHERRMREDAEWKRDKARFMASVDARWWKGQRRRASRSVGGRVRVEP